MGFERKRVKNDTECFGLSKQKDGVLIFLCEEACRRTGLLGGKNRISVLEKLSLKVSTGHPCGVAEKAASFVKQKQKIGQLTCQL